MVGNSVGIYDFVVSLNGLGHCFRDREELLEPFDPSRHYEGPISESDVAISVNVILNAVGHGHLVVRGYCAHYGPGNCLS